MHEVDGSSLHSTQLEVQEAVPFNLTNNSFVAIPDLPNAGLTIKNSLGKSFKSN
jgi:hypothetical protein